MKTFKTSIVTILLLAFTFLASPTFAVVSENVRIQGKVKDINSKTITLSTRTGLVVIPRSALKTDLVRPGMPVSVQTNLKQVFKLTQEFEKQNLQKSRAHK